ncbi:MAG: helix-turn-helix transcriptional regulator [Lamprocystis purpurea]|nr:helix-turn-helix transcriptional regulator [Lamprocystis purpurea]
MASMVGVSPATISKWRAGTQSPEREALERLAGVVHPTSRRWLVLRKGTFKAGIMSCNSLGCEHFRQAPRIGRLKAVRS